jgi:hypothetical protein
LLYIINTMSKLYSDHLFNLVHSLSKAEKRFFKLYTSLLKDTQEKKFIILFEAIEKQKTYDELAILMKERSLNPNQISNLKAHLYKKILKVITLLNTTKDETIELKELLAFAKILYNKCLYKECVKMLDKAKKKALETNSSILLLEILDLEKLVIPKTIEAGNENRVNDLIFNTNSVTESIKNGNVFSNLALKLNAYYVQTGFGKSREDLKNLKRFFYSSLPSFKEKDLTFQEKLHLYNAYIGFYFFSQKFKKGLYYAVINVELFEQFPEMKKHKLEYYIKALNNLLVVQNKLNKLSDFSLSLRKLTALKRNSDLHFNENINLNLFKAIYIHEINRHFMLGEFRSGTRIVHALESELNKFITKLDKHSILLFYYKIACLYIGSEDYREALNWLNKINNEREINLREDIHTFTRILLLICHYELNYDKLLESSIRSTYRYLLKKGGLTLYQKNILFFLKQVFSNPLENKIKAQFLDLKSKMQELEHIRNEKKAFMYFDIISWLESKITKEPIEKIVKNKLRK